VKEGGRHQDASFKQTPVIAICHKRFVNDVPIQVCYHMFGVVEAVKGIRIFGALTSISAFFGLLLIFPYFHCTVVKIVKNGKQVINGSITNCI